jgi:hypothetical protein
VCNQVTGACEEARLEVTSPDAGVVVGVGSPVGALARLVHDGGTVSVRVPVKTDYDAQSATIPFPAGATLTAPMTARRATYKFGWDGGPREDREVEVHGCNGTTCAVWQSCTPSLDGGRCVAAVTGLQFLSPDGGTYGPSAPLTVAVAVTMVDGGVLSADVPVVGPGGPAVLTGIGTVKTLVTTTPVVGGPFSWRTAFDGGVSATGTGVVDGVGPGFTVEPPTLPTYTNSGPLLLADPAAPMAVKKDEVVVLRVTSPATDVNAGAVVLTVRTDGGQTWDAGVGVTCGAAPFCRDYSLALGPQPMNAFTDAVSVSVAGADVLGNPGTGALPNAMTVTRWKWARRVTTDEVRASLAVGSDGGVLVAIRGSAGGLVVVTPQGASTSLASTGPIEASPAIGRNATGADVVFYMDQTSGLRAVGGNPCGQGNPANLGSLAVLNDGTGALRAVGAVWDGTSTSLQAAGPGSCAAIGGAGVPGMAYPGNIVTDGTSVWYPSANGQIQRTGTTLMGLTSQSGFGAGTIYGLSLFGTRLAGGGGGGAGVGRIFVANNDGSNIAGENPMLHVSGVAVGRAGANDVLFALMQTSTEQAELKRFSSDGGVTTATASLAPGFTFNFPASSIPGGTTPVLGANGFVYAVANNGNVAAVDQSTMAVRWTRVLTGLAPPGQVQASATLDCNRDKPGSGTGVYYFATSTGWLVGYIVDSPGLDSTASWPKYQHDARNTGNVGVSTACP